MQMRTLDRDQMDGNDGPGQDSFQSRPVFVAIGGNEDGFLDKTFGSLLEF